MVPNGWNRTTLGEIAEFKNGLNFTKSDKGEAIKIVGVGDFKDFAELRSTDLLETIYVNNRVRDEELLEDGDLLFVRSNGNKDLIGRCLFFPAVATRLSYSGFTIRGRVNKKFALPEYISLVARSSLMKQQISKNGGGTNISNLSQQILSDVVFLLPPLHEQKKIAKILSTWDKAITTTEQLLANSQQQKKALMQQLLTGKKRLLDKNGVRFSGEWKAQRIGSLLKEVKRPVQWDDDRQYHLLSVKRRSEGVVLREILKGSEILTKKMNTALAGDFLISKMQVVHGATGLVTEEFNKCHISDSYIALRPKDDEKIDIAFFSWFSKQKIMYHKAFLCSYGVHIEKMTFNFNMFVKEKVVIPATLEEQQKIAAVLSTTDQEISALQQKLDALKQEKKALMQQLLTGKRRVKVEEAA
ncbi:MULTISPECIES: restriction endonuclease subunit S [Aeromonas]|uniref:restriction endonuclease subunit S n=1 Tax=Aeromonas TaxID=642 RepID=UPI00068BB0C5|nr:restriction endonuclease subunit S [Aeromonas caviae]